MKTEFTFTTSDGIKIFVHKHESEIKSKAVVLIVHGMAEHSQRYDRFAEILNNEGYTVYAYDQRGHGKTAGEIKNLGFFAEKNGWEKVANDVGQLIKTAKKENPDLPIFLLGHSMGSFISRTFAINSGNELSGLMLSGTAGSAGFLGKIGIFLTKIIIMLKGKKSQSKLMTMLSFGDFNKQFKPNRTSFDWLSRDEKEVDKYVNDNFCGTIFSVGFFNDLMNGLEFVNKPENIEKMPKNLPVYLFAGDKDPVSKNGKQIIDLYDMYKKSGMKNIKMKLYKDARHETLNEINRKEVYKDVINWLNTQIN